MIKTARSVSFSFINRKNIQNRKKDTSEETKSFVDSDLNDRVEL